VDLRQSPLRSVHLELNAKLVSFGGWEMPLSYPSGTIREHLSCREDAVVFDVSHLGTLRLDGAASYERLQRGLTNDLAKIGPRRAQYSHLLDEQGSVLDDVIVWWIAPDRFEVMPNASNLERVTAALGGSDVTGSRAVLAIQGPAASRVVEAVLPGAGALKRFCIDTVSFGSEPVTVAGTGYTGEDGVECSVPLSVAAELFRAVIDAGARPAGLGARDTLRLEAGLPLHGHELGPGITPLQAGLGWVVGWDKGDFTGRSALAAERDRGISRRLVGLVSAGRRPLRAGDGILIDGSPVGHLTSGNFSPVLQRGIGLGFVPPATEAGATVSLDQRGVASDAVVVRPTSKIRSALR
jgi:aminomethyltransferase